MCGISRPSEGLQRCMQDWIVSPDLQRDSPFILLISRTMVDADRVVLDAGAREKKAAIADGTDRSACSLIDLTGSCSNAIECYTGVNDGEVVGQLRSHVDRRHRSLRDSRSLADQYCS